MPMKRAFRNRLAGVALAALWSGAMLAAAGPALSDPAAPPEQAQGADDPSRSPRDPAPPEIAAIGVPTGQMGYMGVFHGGSPLYFSIDTRKGGVIDYTLLAIQPSPVRANGVDVVYAVTRHRMDCRRRTDTLIGGQAFDETGRVGAWLAATGPQDYSGKGEEALILAAICARGDPPVVVQGAAGALAHARANGHAEPPQGTHAERRADGLALRA